MKSLLIEMITKNQGKIMRRYLKIFLILGLSGASAQPAFTQDFVTERTIRPGQMETVQSTFNATMPLDETKDLATQQLEALRSFYKMASGSCSEVLATVADSCEIARLTTGVNITETASKGPRMTIAGTIVMKVTFKNTDAKPAE